VYTILGVIVGCFFVCAGITKTDLRTKVITVTGTPPEDGYNADRVLAVVRLHDNGAQIVPK
jgi:hypothetical protein